MDQSVTKLSEPPWVWPRAAYVHVPFCAHHCGYCDFAVVAGRDDQIGPYLDALRAELSTLGRPEPVRTLFIGGGTPSHLRGRHLQRLLRMVREALPLEADDGQPEFSVEANPDDIDDQTVSILADYGVSRVSLGVQSFQPHLLRVLERRHDPAQVPRAVERLRRHIREVSLDLIFGVPGQTPADWADDLRRAIALPIDHVSTYGLTYEKGTRLWKERARGRLIPLSEEAELQLYEQAIDTLEAAGLEQYEISNFARPGHRSRHNQTYWANEAYFGFGLGAARYVRFRRERNTRSLSLYLRTCLAGGSPTVEAEELVPDERAKETLAVQLRRVQGIDRQRFREQTGFDLDDLAGPAIARAVELGLLEDRGEVVRLTRRGRCVADAVITTLL